MLRFENVILYIYNCDAGAQCRAIDKSFYHEMIHRNGVVQKHTDNEGSVYSRLTRSKPSLSLLFALALSPPSQADHGGGARRSRERQTERTTGASLPSDVLVPNVCGLEQLDYFD